MAKKKAAKRSTKKKATKGIRKRAVEPKNIEALNNQYDAIECNVLEIFKHAGVDPEPHRLNLISSKSRLNKRLQLAARALWMVEYLRGPSEKSQELCHYWLGVAVGELLLPSTPEGRTSPARVAKEQKTEDKHKAICKKYREFRPACANKTAARKMVFDWAEQHDDLAV